eukprot:SAG11_NODE_218_length_12212_cov_7.026005_14_plen_89_part_00
MLAELFTKHIIYENGAPAEIVSDRDVRFANGQGFWQSFHTALSIEVGTSVSCTHHCILLYTILVCWSTQFVSPLLKLINSGAAGQENL